MHLTSIPRALGGHALPSFFHSAHVLRVVALVMTVLGRPDAEKELECVTEIISVVAVERIGAVVDGELGAKTYVDAFAV